ncbi:hypothetical protein [Methylobacter sp. YRD-M1]|uniref:hypothetical protein n=1 Tax=Methylobacter sp. YRD-M1 TaxID=2911520 RepID=UPI00227D5AA1|nr:hypothetical protein [Methylobacter sp. YRD-M1]WAK02599.1 hypothetical protein LZ558_02070 [Methylobacter sp. YRD-M1]
MAGLFNDLLKRIKQNAKGVLDLDERLMRAVFEPACRAGVFEESALPWESLDRSCSADDLIALLLPLSEYYQEINPPLSAALWGIWNASWSFRRQRSLLSMLFQRKSIDASVFVEIKGLVATAALQFSDGTASTVVTSDAFTNYSGYQKRADAALETLTLLAKQTPNGSCSYRE